MLTGEMLDVQAEPFSERQVRKPPLISAPSPMGAGSNPAAHFSRHEKDQGGGYLECVCKEGGKLQASIVPGPGATLPSR